MFGISISLVALDQAESVLVEFHRACSRPLPLRLLASRGWFDR